MTLGSIIGIATLSAGSLLWVQSAQAQQGWRPAWGFGGAPTTRHPTAAANAAGSAVVAVATTTTPGLGPLAVFAARRPDPDGPWLGPVQISAGGGDAQFPHAAMTAAGTAVVVWQQIAGNQSRIRVAEFAAGGSAWRAPFDLSPPGADATRARVVACGDTTTVLWLAGSVPQAVRRQGAASWGPIATLDPVGAASAPLVVETAPSCEVTVAWRRETTDRRIVTAVAAASAGTWSAAEPVSSPGEDPSGVAVAAAPDGVTTVAWHTPAAGPGAVRAARRSGGVWSPPTTVAPSTGSVTGVALAVDRGGIVTAVWAVRTASQPHVIDSSRFDAATGGWAPPIRVAQLANHNPPGTLAAITDRTGTVTLAYAFYLGLDLPQLATARFDPFAGTWQASGGFMGDSASLASLPREGVLVAWLSYPQPGAPASIATSDYDPTPLAPTITATTPADGVVTLAVTPPVSQGGFEPLTYDYSIDGGASWRSREPASPLLPVTIDGLTNDVTYPVSVRAVNRSGAGAPSAVVTATPLGRPRAPTDFHVSARTATTVTLAWRATGTVDGFALDGGVQPGQTLVSLPVAGTARTIEVPLGPGVYSARIHALRSGLRSAPSVELTFAVGLPLPPAAPRHLLGLTDGASVALSWTTALEGGPVQAIRLDVAGSLRASALLPPGESFAVASVPAGAYRVEVAAVNAAGASPPSNAVVLLVPEPCSGAPNPPAALEVATSGTTVRVRWEPPDAGAAVGRYDLAVQGSFNGTLALTARELTASARGTFTIRVVAVNPCGTSAPTPPRTIVLPQP